MTLTVIEVAELVKIHPNTVRAEIDRGHLKAWRAGSSIRIETEEVEAWKLRKQTTQSKAPARPNLEALRGGKR